jgi:HEPN domain-containing protein
MTGRLHAWLRQAHSDLAMAAYASQGGFHAQACYHCCQAAEKALKALLLALGQEPERTPTRSSDCSALWSCLASRPPRCANCRSNPCSG